jgi:hypothetical protein
VTRPDGGEYLIQLSGLVYEPADGRKGWPLPEAMREVYGTAGAWILRGDGTLAVMAAGNAGEVTHVGRGSGGIGERLTRVRRRPVRRLCWARVTA